MVDPNKVDRDAVQTALTITVLSSLLVGLINFGFDELREWRENRRDKSKDPASAASEKI